jgi:hypothetical protein
MILAVYLEKSDTCGNTDIYGPLGYIDVESIEEGEEIFPKGFLVGYRLEPVIPSYPLTLHHKIETDLEKGRYR